MHQTSTSTTIAAQNDQFRAELLTLAALTQRGVPGRSVMTRRVALLDPVRLARILQAVVTFSAFTPANDPYGEHDFGSLEDDGDRLLWKIDYYADASMTFGAADARESYRVLTIMFAEEY